MFEMQCILRAIEEGKISTVWIERLPGAGGFICTIDSVVEGRGDSVTKAVADAAEKVPVHIARRDFTRPIGSVTVAAPPIRGAAVEPQACHKCGRLGTEYRWCCSTAMGGS